MNRITTTAILALCWWQAGCSGQLDLPDTRLDGRWTMSTARPDHSATLVLQSRGTQISGTGSWTDSRGNTSVTITGVYGSGYVDVRFIFVDAARDQLAFLATYDVGVTRMNGELIGLLAGDNVRFTASADRQ